MLQPILHSCLLPTLLPSHKLAEELIKVLAPHPVYQSFLIRTRLSPGVLSILHVLGVLIWLGNRNQVFVYVIYVMLTREMDLLMHRRNNLAVSA